jgi:tryptophan synthase beta chain
MINIENVAVKYENELKLAGRTPNTIIIDKWINSRSLLSKNQLDKIYINMDITKERAFRPNAVIEHCQSKEKYIDIPKEVQEFYRHIGRATLLHRAKRLEKALNTRNRIFLKREDILINGSFKINLIGPQVFFGVNDGYTQAVVETSAGHVGVATAFAASYFGIKSTVFVTDTSYLNKPYRRYMMEMYGAQVLSSPSQYTKIGKQMFSEGKSGSIAKATSEVLEVVNNDNECFKISGSLSDQTLT